MMITTGSLMLGANLVGMERMVAVKIVYVAWDRFNHSVRRRRGMTFYHVAVSSHWIKEARTFSWITIYSRFSSAFWEFHLCHFRAKRADLGEDMAVVTIM